MEQAPGPRGSPHDPQAPPGLAGAVGSWDFSPRTAKLESCWLSRLLSHLGHAAFCAPRTMASNSWWHCRQTYSKIGILCGSVKIVTALIIATGLPESIAMGLPESPKLPKVPDRTCH